MNRTGELWEHLWLRYLVVKRTKSGTGWHAIRLHDYYESEPPFVILTEEFFEQEWWEKVT